MIYIMSGIPGIGKSTWIKNNMKNEDICISRDCIRFNMLEPDDDYFAHEKEVLKEFYDEIEYFTTKKDKEGLIGDIYIDATHISPKTRKRTMNHIYSKDDIICVYFKPNINKAIEQNKERTGRAKTPITAILSQADKYVKPTLEEGFNTVMCIY